MNLYLDTSKNTKKEKFRWEPGPGDGLNDLVIGDTIGELGNKDQHFDILIVGDKEELLTWLADLRHFVQESI